MFLEEEKKKKEQEMPIFHYVTRTMKNQVKEVAKQTIFRNSYFDSSFCYAGKQSQINYVIELIS